MPFFLTQYLKSLGDNWGEVTPLIYRSAQPSADRLKELRFGKYKIQVNLNLRDDYEEEERNEVLRAGIIPWNIPMRDDRAPEPWQIRKALDVLRGGDEVKLICCRGGRHRTSVIAAIYRVLEQHWTKQEAWAEAYKFGFYRFGGHGPIEDWFLEVFDPNDFK